MQPLFVKSRDPDAPEMVDMNSIIIKVFLQRSKLN